MQTLKHVLLFVFVLATLALLIALVPMNVSSAPLQAPALQDTVAPPPVTIEVTAVVPVTSIVVPVTGDPGMSPTLVIGLLVLIGIAIVVFALALTNPNRSNDLPPR